MLDRADDAVLAETARWREHGRTAVTLDEARRRLEGHLVAVLSV